MIGIDVKSSSQANLEDDGKRSWREEIKVRLDQEYPGWQSPKETTMVPPVFYYKSHNPDKGKHTERKVYNLLQQFGEVQKQGMFVVHSARFREKILKWNENETEEEKNWLTGEHDFVIIHPAHGIVFFQVKAATKTARAFIKCKLQLDKDQECLQVFCLKHLETSAKKRKGKDHLYHSLGFVVMPNCPRPDWETNYGIFKEDCETVEAFTEWWENNVSVKLKEPIDKELYDCMVMR